MKNVQPFSRVSPENRRWEQRTTGPRESRAGDGADLDGSTTAVNP